MERTGIHINRGLYLWSDHSQWRRLAGDTQVSIREKGDRDSVERKILCRCAQADLPRLPNRTGAGDQSSAQRKGGEWAGQEQPPPSHPGRAVKKRKTLHLPLGLTFSPGIVTTPTRTEATETPLPHPVSAPHVAGKWSQGWEWPRAENSVSDSEGERQEATCPRPTTTKTGFSFLLLPSCACQGHKVFLRMWTTAIQTMGSTGIFWISTMTKWRGTNTCPM